MHIICIYKLNNNIQKTSSIIFYTFEIYKWKTKKSKLTKPLTINKVKN
jgi:hypothetical protein